MICQRCLRRLARPSALAQQQPSQSSTAATLGRRSFTHTPRQHSTPITAQTATATNPRPHDGAPAALSTPAVAQPFSTPLSSSEPKAEKLTQAPRVKSSVPAGTVLKGLNFLKSKQDPIALEDAEYPEWLWGVLEKGDGSGSGKANEGDGDLFSKSKKQRQRAAKALRKRELANPGMLAPKLPLHEQSVDLPAGDGSVTGAKRADEAREALTKAMRDKRRSKIKEANFLKAMG